MLAIAMSPPTPHIQTQGLHDSSATSLSSVSSALSGQMLVASPSPLSPSKRPKLSLQTSSVPVAVGKSSTGLTVSISALQNSSPTVRNTFNNAYETTHRSSPAISSNNASKWPKPIVSNIGKREDQPYELPVNLRGILKNAPYIPSIRRSGLSLTNSASPRNSRKVFFPAIKKVAWRNMLEEEVKTVKFIARHSDLSSEEDTEDNLSRSRATGLLRTPTISKEEPSESWRGRAGTPTASRREDTASGAESETDKQTPEDSNPMHTKRKRRPPEWRWTLDPFGVEDEEEEREGKEQAEPRSRPASSVFSRLGLTVDTAKISCFFRTEDEESQGTPFPLEARHSHSEEATVSPAS